MDVAGVELGKRGEVRSDSYLRTTAAHIFVAGNAFASRRLLPGVAGGISLFDDPVVPWVAFTAVVTLDEMDRPCRCAACSANATG